MKLGPGQFLGRTQEKWERQGLTVTLSEYRPKNELPWHAHANPGFFLVLSGQHRDRSRHGDHDQSELTLVFHPTHEAHAGFIGPRGAVGLNIEYDPQWLERHALRQADLGGYRPLESVSSRLQVLAFLGMAFQKGDHASADCESQAFELLEPLINLPASPEPTRFPAWLRRAESYMHEEFRTPISLRVCAREANIHPVHLARVFRKRFGCSVSEYLRALRLLEAGRLVLHEGSSIAQAAQRAGFADHAHFTRSCSRRFGFCPRSLRIAKNLFHL